MDKNNNLLLQICTIFAILTLCMNLSANPKTASQDNQSEQFFPRALQVSRTMTWS